MMIGTYSYMSPEQVRDAAKVDPRTDVWALGVVLYEILTGKKPFDGAEPTEILYQIVHESPPTPDKLRPGLSADLVTAIDQALQKDIEKRLPSVSALAQALAPFTGRSSLHPAQLMANGDGATRPAPVTSTVAVRATTSHAAISTVSKISRASSAGLFKSRRAVLIAAIALVLVIGVAGLMWLRPGGRVEASAVSSSAPENPLGASRSAVVPAAQLPPGAASAPVSASVATPSKSANDTSDKVQTLSEVVGQGSDKTPPNSADKANLRPNVPQTTKKAANPRGAPAPGRGTPVSQPDSPVSIDTSSPY